MEAHMWLAHAQEMPPIRESWCHLCICVTVFMHSVRIHMVHLFFYQAWQLTGDLLEGRDNTAKYISGGYTCDYWQRENTQLLTKDGLIC